MAYVDGFLIAVPKKKLNAYVKMSKKAGKIWREYGALEYKETVEDDVKSKGFYPFPKAARVTRGEVVVFSYIVYKSKAHRNAVNKKVMKDERIQGMCDADDMPFDPKKMCYGGFKVVVDE